MKSDLEEHSAALDLAADVAQLELLQRQLAKRSERNTHTREQLALLKAKLDHALLDLAARK